VVTNSDYNAESFALLQGLEDADLEQEDGSHADMPREMLQGEEEFSMKPKARAPITFKNIVFFSSHSPSSVLLCGIHGIL
jgi:hypothetical protein